MSWIYLFIAGLFEIGFAIGLKYSQGLHRPLPILLTVISMVASVVLLGKAAETIAIGTAYGIWVGIGAVGTMALGVILFDDPMPTSRVVFASMLVVSLVGLKMTSPA